MIRIIKTATFVALLILLANSAPLRAAEAPPAIDAATAPTDAADVCPAKIGTRIPKLSLTDIEGKKTELNPILAQKPTVLVFYRGGWCPYCNAQLSQLRTVQAELLKLGYQIVAVSPDLPTEQRKSLIRQQLNYTLMSDSRMTAALALGIAYEVDDATFNQYKGQGINLEKQSGEMHHLLPVPSVFVLDTEGTIQFSYVNPDYRVRLNPDVLLAAAKAALPPPNKPAPSKPAPK